MPAILLPPVLGLQSDGSLVPGAKLLKIYPAFFKLKDLPLNEVPVANISATLTFQEPLSLSAGSLQLLTGVNAGGSLQLIGEQHQVLDFEDPFSAIPVAAGEIYLALGLNFALTGGATITAETLTFGLSCQRDLTLKCYRRFQRIDNKFPPFGSAFSATAASFVLPQTVSDLAGFPADTVCVISGDGVLTVTGGVTFATPVQMLASTSLPFGKTLDVNASGSFATTVTLTFSGGYEIRVRRIADHRLELGIYGIKSRELDVSVEAEAGVAAQVGTFDLTEKFIKALSRQPLVDVEEFRRALPGEDPVAREEKIESIESSLKRAITSQLQASVTTTFSDLRSSEAAWLFEIDLDAATSPESQAAIESALKGDFRPLTSSAGSLPAGIRQTMNAFTRSNLNSQKLVVNFLGLANYLSLTKLLRVSTVEHGATGAVTLITDTSSASRLQALVLIAALDHNRLRKMLSETFVIEAAYHVSNLSLLPPDFLARHTYFSIHDQTGADDMRNGLAIGRVLGLISPDEENRRLTKADFGRTTLFVQTKYTSDKARLLFLTDSDEPRAIEEFETAGRSALRAILDGQSGQEFRLRFAQLGDGDALWAKMKSLGNTATFGPLFGLDLDSTDPRLEAVGSDFVTITSWASAMNTAAVALKEVETLLGNTPVGVDDARQTNARAHLNKSLEVVVSKTHDHFGDPLGLLMAYVAGGEMAAKSMLVTGPQIETLDVNSEPALAKHA